MLTLKQLKKYNKQKLTQKAVGDMYGVSDQSIRRWCKQLQYKWKPTRPNKYIVDNYYFHKWSHDMAYILGYAMADAYIEKSENRQVQVAFKSIDKDLITYIQDRLDTNYPIDVYQPINSCKLVYRLRINSDILGNQFIKLGVIPHRTGNEYLPYIPEQYKSSYLCGLFDGDGHIGKNKRVWYICSSSLYFLKQLRDNFVVLNTSLIRQEQRKNANKMPLYYLKFHKRNKIMDVCRYIYSNVSFCLNRKYQIYNNMLED